MAHATWRFVWPESADARLAFGWLTDAVAGWLGINVVAQLHASRDPVPEWLALICGLLLIILAVPVLRASLLRRLKSSAR